MVTLSFSFHCKRSNRISEHLFHALHFQVPRHQSWPTREQLANTICRRRLRQNQKRKKNRTSCWIVLRLLTRACRATLHLHMHRHCLHHRSPAAWCHRRGSGEAGKEKMWPDSRRCKEEMIGGQSEPGEFAYCIGDLGLGLFGRVRER